MADHARAGIERYWLIDTDPDLGITVLRLVGATYVQHARADAGEMLSLAEPFPVQVEVSALRDQ